MTTISNPTAGGSYSRDPKTGALTQLEQTKQALPRGWAYVDGVPTQVDANGKPIPQPKPAQE